MAGALTQNVQTANAFASLFSNLFGNKTSVTTSGGDETTQTILSQDVLNKLLKSALEGNQGLATVAGGQRSAGLYNSTTNQLLTNDLLARLAVNQAAVSAPKVTTKAPTTQTEKKEGALSGMSSGDAAILAGLGLLADKNVRKGIKDFFGDMFGGGGTPEGKADVASRAIAPGDGVTSFGSVADSVGITPASVTRRGVGMIGSSLGTAVGGFFGPLGAFAGSVLGGDLARSTLAPAEFSPPESNYFTADMAAAITADENPNYFTNDMLAAIQADNLAAAAEQGFTPPTVTTEGITNFGDTSFGEFSPPAIQSVDFFGDGGGGRDGSGLNTGNGVIGGQRDGGGRGGGGGKVICTELYLQGRMPYEIYAADQKFGKLQSFEVMFGYHYWAIPLVAWMKASPRVTNIVAFFALPWAQHMAFQMKAVETDSFFGKCIMKFGLAFCKTVYLALSLKSRVVKEV